MASNQLRSLMKERQAAKRISHPYARYVGPKLTCTACGGMAVKAEALWASHLTAKSHRLNVQRLQKEQEQAAAAAQAQAAATAAKGKRRADDEDDQSVERTPGGTAKRVRFSEAEEDGADVDGEAAEAPTSGLPAGFFDDPSQAPPPTVDDADEDDAAPAPAEDEDPEWAAFEATLNASDAKASAGEAFARATVMAEPVIYKQPDEEGEEAEGQEEEVEEGEEEGPQETEEERRIREEKEEIMERIETEEREQAEADERVVRMKARLDAIRAARAGKKTT